MRKRSKTSREENAPGFLRRSMHDFLVRWRSNRVKPIPGTFGNSLCLIVVLALAYTALGRLSVSMADGSGSISHHIFFAEGWALVFAIVFGPRVVPGVFLGQFALAQLSGLPLIASGIIACVNAVEIALGGYLFWYLRISPRFNRPREVGLFVALCALILQPLSATGGVVAHHFFVEPLSGRLATAGLYWWLANVLGQVLVGPLILSWLSRPWDKKDRGELHLGVLISILYLVPVAIFVLSDWGANTPLYRLLLFVTFYLPLLGIAVQSRPRTVSLLALLLTVPFISFVHVGPELSHGYWNPTKYFVANFVIFTAVVTALLISTIREQVVDRNRQLHDSIHARERLLAVIGHDLRGPVGVLKNYLDLMAEGDLSREEFREVQDDLRKGVDHANDTLGQLLEWADAQASSALRQSNVDLRACVDEAAALLSLMAERKEIEVENAVPPEAGVWGDEHQLQSVFRNLLTNAIKFTRPNGRVTVTAEAGEGCWNIAVRDTGIGMKREWAAGLFRLANEYRSTPGTENERGVGLGLQLCREFVQANAGKIKATSRPGLGTTIHVKLPAAKRGEGNEETEGEFASVEGAEIREE